MTTGPLHYSLLQRSRANDNQLYVACVSPARGSPPEYVAWGHTQLTNPWGEILHELDAAEDMVVADIGNSSCEAGIATDSDSWTLSRFPIAEKAYG